MSDWRQSPRWIRTRKLCARLHHYKCTVTGKRVKNGHVHHIYDASNFPKYRYNQKYLVYIDKHIHRMFHVEFMGGYDKKCTLKDWKAFLTWHKRRTSTGAGFRKMMLFLMIVFTFININNEWIIGMLIDYLKG